MCGECHQVHLAIQTQERKAGFRKSKVVFESAFGLAGGVTVKILKVKKNVPTVIEYEGRRYVLDMTHQPKKEVHDEKDKH
jgi:hypothetical protein